MDLHIFLLVLASGLLHAVWNFAAKKSSGNLASGWLAQFVAMFFLFSIAGVRYAYGARGGTPFEPTIILYIAGAGFLQAMYFLLLANAYQLGDVSVVYPIARGVGVAGAAMVGIFSYNEVPTVLGFAGCTAVACGAAFIGFASYTHSLAGRRSVELAVMVGLCLAFGSFIDKRAVSTFDPPLYLAFVYICAILLSSPYYLARKRRSRVRNALMMHTRSIFIIGIGASFTYLIILYALQRGPLGYIAAVREVSIVFGAATGVYLLKEKITRSKVIGLSVIALGIVLIRLG